MKDDVNETHEGQPATIEHLIALLVSSNKLLVDVNIKTFYQYL